MTTLFTLIKSPLIWLAMAVLASWGLYGHQARQVQTLRTQLHTTQRDLTAEKRAHDQLKHANQATVQHAQGTAANDTQTTTQLATVAGAAARERTDRLRDSPELAAFNERHRAMAQSAADAQQRAAAADQALRVCTDLLGRADETAGELAGHADELGARLEGAERWADLTASTINAGAQATEVTEP